MRFVVQKESGDFIRIDSLGGRGGADTYAFSTPDAQDAHDFKSRENASRWLSGRGISKADIRVLNDDGSWPLDE
ncbi:MAG: hypothetical protein ACSHX9_02180 [Luteolibacter sp.]